MKDNKLFSGLSTILPSVYDSNTYEYKDGGGSFQLETYIDPEFKLDESVYNDYLKKGELGTLKGKCLLLFLDGKVIVLAKGIPESNAKELLELHKVKLGDDKGEFKIIDIKDLDKYKNDFLEGNKTFSKYYTISDRDVWEYFIWKSEPRYTPKLLLRFINESDYEEYIEETNSKELTLSNDPAIIKH